MSQQESIQFNAFFDTWLPLLQENGATIWASPVELLCGEKDGVDIDVPRDDFKVYTRLLLSALVQAMFPAPTKGDLMQRLAAPLSRATVEKALAPVHADFDLFGPKPFLQVLAPAKAPENGAAPFVFPGEDLYRSRVQIEAIGLSTALVMLFIEQAYAGGAGRGYGAGPGGQPGAMTLIDPGSVRRGAWANTLTLEWASSLYPPDGKMPWSNDKRSARPRSATGLVEGLFFQPRSIWLIPVGHGQCSFTGTAGPLVRRSPYLPKSELTKRTVDDLWQHPCAPMATNSQGLGPVRLHEARPAWTGLAQLLDPIAKESKNKRHPNEGPAPVLQQWKTLNGQAKRPRLLVLDFVRDKANVKRRFYEAYPLTEQFVGSPEAMNALRDIVSDTQHVQRALASALSRAHDRRKQGGLAAADASSSFWATTEVPFLDWLGRAASVHDADAADSAAEVAMAASAVKMKSQSRETAMRTFNAHVQLSEFDPAKQALVANARRALLRDLFGR